MLEGPVAWNPALPYSLGKWPGLEGSFMLGPWFPHCSSTLQFLLDLMPCVSSMFPAIQALMSLSRTLPPGSVTGLGLAGGGQNLPQASLPSQPC